MKTISPDSPPDATQDFAQHMAGAKFENLPAAAIAATKRSIFDTVGVMLAGSGPHGNAWRIVGVLPTFACSLYRVQLFARHSCSFSGDPPTPGRVG